MPPAGPAAAGATAAAVCARGGCLDRTAAARRHCCCLRRALPLMAGARWLAVGQHCSRLADVPASPLSHRPCLVDGWLLSCLTAEEAREKEKKAREAEKRKAKKEKQKAKKKAAAAAAEPGVVQVVSACGPAPGWQHADAAAGGLTSLPRLPAAAQAMMAPGPPRPPLQTRRRLHPRQQQQKRRAQPRSQPPLTKKRGPQQTAVPLLMLYWKKPLRNRLPETQGRPSSPRSSRRS